MMPMTLHQVGGVLLILLLCPLLGALPLLQWWVWLVTGQDLRRLGTGNVSVSAAFYHGGRSAGLTAVASEAAKGIGAVLLARYFFPAGSMWELVAVLALVLGRFWASRGAGTTNVVWATVAHDPIIAGLCALICGAGFTVIREREAGRNFALAILPATIWMMYPHQLDRVGAAIALSGVLFWIYQKIPDDLDLPSREAQPESQKVFRWFRADRALASLDQELDPAQVGAKAANLAQVRRWGYAVPLGWIWQPGDDFLPLLETTRPHPDRPLIARSSVMGEDSLRTSAAGQYVSVADVTSADALELAIEQCLLSYDKPPAQAYRRDQDLPDGLMSVLVQYQIHGVFSGVAFSRDPVMQTGDWVAIEALPGGAAQVVSGRLTPERYRVLVPEDIPTAIPSHCDRFSDRFSDQFSEQRSDSGLTNAQTSPNLDATSKSSPPFASEPFEWVARLEISREDPDILGDVPEWLLREVGAIARQLERKFNGIPQDLEWSYDGDRLWILQVRPISTLYPIWTRKIAAEVAPGAIHPLSWSISQPLTCGVWGEIFTTVLGARSADLPFHETATLHHAHAYFNASLLGDIFLRMGLPPESLEFLLRDRPMTRPPLWVTLRNLPGLLRLFGQQFTVMKQFARDDSNLFTPLLAEIAQCPAIHVQMLDTGLTVKAQLDPAAAIARIENLLSALRFVTRYNILVPIGFAIRQKMAGVEQSQQLDQTVMPEVQATRSLQALANELRVYAQTEQPELLTTSIGLQNSTDFLSPDPIPDSISADSVDSFAMVDTADTAPVSELKPVIDRSSQTTVTENVWQQLQATPTGQRLAQQFQAWLDRYGYLSDVGTNLAIPTWGEQPEAMQQLWLRLAQAPARAEPARPAADRVPRSLQQFAQLKGRVAEVYDRLLAELRGCFLAIEQAWQSSELAGELAGELGETAGKLAGDPVGESVGESVGELRWQTGDIFFLSWHEVRQNLPTFDPATLPEFSREREALRQTIRQRRAQFEHDRQLTQIPHLIYGTPSFSASGASVAGRGAAGLSRPNHEATIAPNATAAVRSLQGIGASSGTAEGRILLLPQFDATAKIDRQTIVVVPYTDAGWSPLLAQAGGVIAAIGGRLSHGAIVAREYGIPAVMDVADAFQCLRSGQWVRIDGTTGAIELL